MSDLIDVCKTFHINKLKNQSHLFKIFIFLPYILVKNTAASSVEGHPPVVVWLADPRPPHPSLTPIVQLPGSLLSLPRLSPSSRRMGTFQP